MLQCSIPGDRKRHHSGSRAAQQLQLCIPPHIPHVQRECSQKV